jgi:outer membrane protein assembly factor BamA
MAVEVTGNVFFTDQYLTRNDFNARDQDEVERLISRILDTYNNAGFPFCRVSPELIQDELAPARILLKVDEGARVIIEDLLIKTGGKTDIHAAKRLAHFKTGAYFSLRDVASAKKRLTRTKAFTEIKDNILDRDGTYYLLFTLKEKESDFLTLSGSFSGSDLHFGASFSSYSLLGTLRQLSFDFDYERLFSLKFREPVLIVPATFEANFAIWTYDSTRQIEGNVKFSAPIGEYFSASVLSGIEIVTQYGTDSIASQSSDNLLGTGIGFDYEVFPWRISQELYVDYLFRDADRLRLKYDSEIEFRHFVLGIHYHRVQTDSLEFFDYLRIGGSRNLRGYLEDEFLATRAVWFNFEYHRFFIFPLLDIARIQDDLVYSYGFGIQAKSRFADASLILAWPRGGNWEDGKLHLTFAKGF